MKRTSVVLVALFMAALAPTAVADGIPFTGTALVGNAEDLNFSMTGLAACGGSDFCHCAAGQITMVTRTAV